MSFGPYGGGAVSQCAAITICAEIGAAAFAYATTPLPGVT